MRAGSTLRRVAVTGIGCITPIGNGPDGLLDGLRRGESAVRRIDWFDVSPFRSQVAAPVARFDPLDHFDAARVRRLDRYSQFAITATRMALDDAGIAPEDEDPDRVGIQMGSALGGVAYAEEQMGRFVADGVKGVSPMLALTVYAGAASCNVAIEFGFTGPNSTNGMSCASGAMAIGDGWRLIRSGEADVVVAGGAEAPLMPLCFGAFSIIRAMSTRNEEPARASRPFDAGRDGFVMAEGAAVLVLEEMQRARARGARIYGELLGFGSTTDAHHMTAPREDGVQAARAMRLALASARLEPEDIDYVNAHGSSTPLNDSTESRVIRRVLGDHADRIPVSGTKGFHGHALGATGAMEAASTLLSIRHGWIPPTLNLEDPGPDCDLPYTSGAGEVREIRHAISNSFGFGGINAALVFGAVPADRALQAASAAEQSNGYGAITSHRTEGARTDRRPV
jgi:3-oxoacyl-[acyl-carrier-protein] synthase II